jgi:hypothetical protein
MFAKARITEAPIAWEGIEAAFVTLKNPGQARNLAYAPSSWIDLEPFSMVNNVPVASNNNGYDGLDTELLFGTTQHFKHIENIRRWMTEGYAMLRTQAAGKTTRQFCRRRKRDLCPVHRRPQHHPQAEANFCLERADHPDVGRGGAQEFGRWWGLALGAVGQDR